MRVLLLLKTCDVSSDAVQDDPITPLYVTRVDIILINNSHITLDKRKSERLWRLKLQRHWLTVSENVRSQIANIKNSPSLYDSRLLFDFLVIPL